MLASIFRTRSIAEGEGDVWIIRLTFYSDLDPDLKLITEHVKTRNIDDKTNFISLGNVLLDTARYEEAEKYFRRFLNVIFQVVGVPAAVDE